MVNTVKNILICSSSYPPEKNGLSHVVYEHAQGLTDIGFKVTIATSYNAERSSNILNDGIGIYEFKTYGQGRIFSKFKGEVDEYVNFLIKSDYDIIFFHAWQCWSTELAVMFSDKIKAKKVLVSHGTSFSYLPRSFRGIFRWLLWQTYALKFIKSMKAFDHYVFLSEKSDNIRFKDKYIADKIGLVNWSVIPNGGDVGFTNTTKIYFKELYSINKKYIYLSVANFSPDKNQMALLKAFKKSSVDDAILVLIGSTFNSYAKKLIKYTLNDQFLKQNVLILEKQSKDIIRAAYVAADIFLSASVTEAQPLMILDAMASGTPFISTNVGCVSELPGGIVVDSSAQIADQILKLANDPSLLNSLAHYGLTASSSKYNWNLVINEYKNLIYTLSPEIKLR